MSDSLQILIQKNKEKQERLEGRYHVLKEHILQRAITWIDRKDPDQARLLLGVTDVDLVIKNLPLAYKREPWSSSENEETINSILFPKEQAVFNFIMLSIGLTLPELFLLGSGVQPYMLLGVLLLVAFTFFPTRLIGRWLIKVLITRFDLNLTWYAPIILFFKIEKKCKTERRLLLIEEQNLTIALQQEEEQKLREEEERVIIERDEEANFHKRLNQIQETG